MPPGTAGQENEPNVWPTLIAVKCKRQKGEGDGGGETFRNDSTGFSFLVARFVCDFLSFFFAFWALELSVRVTATVTVTVTRCD